MTPKISVVMSCYNEEGTIATAVDSILNQTERDFEFIIIDDGSKDATLEIALSFINKDNRIRLFQNPNNLGLAASLNKGIAEAKGKYIARMDADDVSVLTRFQKQVDHLEKNPELDILGTNVFFVKNGKQSGQSELPLSDKNIYESRYSKTVLVHPSVMLRRDSFDKYGEYDPKLTWAEDKDLWLRWMGKASFANLTEPLLYYTVKENISRKIFYYNHVVLMSNMIRRKELLRNVHFLLKSILSHSLLLIRSIAR